MKKISLALAILAILLCVGISGIASAASTSTTESPMVTVKLVGDLIIQDADGTMSWLGPIPGLVGPGGGIQLRVLANAAPWLHLEWDATIATVTIENEGMGHYLTICGDDVITCYQDPAGIGRIETEGCTIQNIEGRTYLAAPYWVWSFIGITVWSSVENTTDVIDFHVQLANPSAPPPTLGGQG